MANTTPPQTTYSYQPLSAATNEIRILCLSSNTDPQSEIKCRVEHVPLMASSNYIALSYCWGGSDKTARVRVNNQAIYVTPRLVSALKELRQQGKKRIWADAICINQDDEEERSHQVLRMAAIYRSAKSVIAWLGHAEPSAVQGILGLIDAVEKLLAYYQGFNDERNHVLRHVARHVTRLSDKKYAARISQADYKRFSRALKHIQENLRDSDWQALGLLLKCEYWSRVWIIQELSMANRLSILWGRHDFTFLSLANLVKAYQIMHKANLVGEIIPSGACRHVKNLHEFKILQSGLKAVPLIRALKMTSFAKSTDVRDKVYGLMGLTYDGSIIFPAPSYGMEANRVNLDATLRIIRLENSLDHIVFRSKDPSSWVIDWFDSQSWLDSRVVSYLNGSTQFHLKSNAYTKWSAAESSQPRLKIQGRHLVVKGLILDTIHTCSGTFEERQSKSKRLATARLGKRPDEEPVRKASKNRVRKALAISFNILNDEFKAEDFLIGLQFGLQEWASKKVKTSKRERRAAEILEWFECPLNSSFKISNYSLHSLPCSKYKPWSDDNDLYWEALDWAATAVSATAKVLRMGMRLGQTANGKIGWFTKHSRPQDVIAVLSGCTVPVVLRPIQDGEYMIVGDSIIFGKMLGEAFEKTKLIDIKLC
ncbi:heterokaryon incompatibility protein-domain-containing protein [Dactylonectria estremocensis]|uniref:Heterokaryon incompatibility protein-domain-containing protein n=1 Tax=Dactylonectria estremocensis TaxID=1079267 RepID=A0A9P9F5H2_9HYPO|nr:heterokaryon incompatibility protein-domain-containing protein [Dactylonectria estremocensis]